jgi:hypothetical protein
MSTDAGMHRMIKKSLDQSCREINKLSMKLFISIIFNIIYLTTFKLAGCRSKYLKENIKFYIISYYSNGNRGENGNLVYSPGLFK